MDFSRVENLLLQEEQASPAMSRVELAHRHERRLLLNKELSAFQTTVNALYKRYHRLPKLPSMSHVEWANALLQFPNLTILVIDSTGVRDDSDILRILLIDGKGTLVFDRLLRPQRQTGQANTFYTGIAREHILNAPLLADIWEELQTILVGRYILTYNLDFLVERLRENALAAQLPPLFFIGECLMNRAASYYHASTTLKLTDICGRIGYPLPQPATAQARAAGQLAFLRAMAQGITTVHDRSPVSSDTGEDDLDDSLDDHPF